MNPVTLLTRQQIISTRHFQSKFAKIVKEAEKKDNYYNVVKNGESLGIFMPRRAWESFLEDLEALSSKSYLKKIKEARAERGGYTLKQLLKEYK